MKTILKLTATVYCIIAVGGAAYMLINPEGYGRIIGKVVYGFNNELEEE